MKNVLIIIASIILLGFLGYEFSHLSTQAQTDNSTPSSTAATDDEHPWMEKFSLLFNPPPPKKQITPQDKAALLARDGHYEEALTIYNKLHDEDKSNQSVTRDMVAVLGWAGHDQDAISLYETLPPTQPDYVLAAVGHSYRVLNQLDKAVAVYHLGLQQSPSNVLFAEGEIRCLADEGKLEDALAKADADLGNNLNSPGIVNAKNDILFLIAKRDQQKAVEMARVGQYGPALTVLFDLHTKYPDNVSITQDYLAVLGWQGGNDEKVISLYTSLPASNQPDYVMETVGHSYRQLKRADEAQAVYQKGLQQYPDNVVFMEGYIRTLVDQKKYGEALSTADQDLQTHGQRPPVVEIRKNILRLQNEANKGKSRHRSHSKTG